jgi:hypothetical protein
MILPEIRRNEESLCCVESAMKALRTVSAGMLPEKCCGWLWMWSRIMKHFEPIDFALSLLMLVSHALCRRVFCVVVQFKDVCTVQQWSFCCYEKACEKWGKLFCSNYTVGDLCLFLRSVNSFSWDRDMWNRWVCGILESEDVPWTSPDLYPCSSWVIYLVAIVNEYIILLNKTRSLSCAWHSWFRKRCCATTTKHLHQN